MENLIQDKSKIKKTKTRFFFGNNWNKKIAYIIMRKNHSNFFLTLTDCRARVIICKTAAAVLGKLERRRRRKAPHTIEYIIASLSPYFQLYNIWGIKIIIRIRPGQYINYLIKSLQSRNITVIKVFNYRKLPYSKTRGRRKKY